MVLLDHVIVAVADLDEAVAVYAAITGRPPALRSRSPRGTQNALFLFPSGPYLELLAPWQEAPERGTSAEALARRLAERGPGLSGIALAPADIDAAVERLRTAGEEAMTPVANGARNDDGRERTWRAARLPSIAGDSSYLVQHTGWDWRAELLPPVLPERQGSAVRAIHYVAFDVTEANASDRWGGWTGVLCGERLVSEAVGAEVLIHQLGAATVEFVSATRPDGPVAERIARRGAGLFGLAFEVTDLDAAVAAVRAVGVIVSEPAPGVLANSRVARIDPGSACGVAAQLLEFAARAEG